MTVSELRIKHPSETKDWTDEKCQEYCRTLETLTNLYIQHVVDQQQKRTTIDSHAN